MNLKQRELPFRFVGYEPIMKETHSVSLFPPSVLDMRCVSLYIYITLLQPIPFSTNRLKLMKRTLQREVITKVRIAGAKWGHQLIFSSRSYQRALSRSNRATSTTHPITSHPRHAAAIHPISLHKWHLNKGKPGRTAPRPTQHKYEYSVKPLITPIS